jgi:general secretion pathway protein K
VTCAGAPTADVCVDPTQASAFLLGITMARGITQGAPIFGSANDFLQMMKGQGQLGPMITLLGMKPVKFLSESEFLKSVTTDSKMFSIYAIGVVKGYKRETRTTIHAVVDFRSVPEVSGPSMASVLNSFTGGSPSGSASGSASASATATNSSYPMMGSGSLTTGPITAAMQTTAAGQLIFFHIE